MTTILDVMKKLLIGATLLAGTAISLAACGGGGGGGTGGGGILPTTSPTNTATVTPTLTSASGHVVDDANGNPLAGVRVVLAPWGTCGSAPVNATPENDGCPTPLPAPQATTDANGNFTLSNAPNGHYLLIIGNDTVATPPPGFIFSASCSGQPCPTPNPVTGTPIQATVHDNVTFSGGTVTLTAPSMPSLATVTPHAWETNGSYRLTTLDPESEAPCYVAWQLQRQSRSLPMASIDEWLTETTRNVNAARISGGVPVNSFSVSVWKTLSGGEQGADGGLDCNAQFGILFAGGFATALAPQTLWVSGQYALDYAAPPGWQGLGFVQFVEDPRAYTDPFVATWI